MHGPHHLLAKANRECGPCMPSSIHADVSSCILSCIDNRRVVEGEGVRAEPEGRRRHKDGGQCLSPYV